MIRFLAGAAGAAVAGVLAVAVLVATALGGEENAAAGTPPAGTAGGAACAEVPVGEIAEFSGDQLANAAAIVREGQRLGVPEQGLVVALATAMQESTLRAVDYGDIMPNGRMSSSRGLFQQLDAWGPLPDRLDPARSAAMFYTGGQAGQPGLLDIPGWEALPVTAAAQAVQRSETPTAYAQWEQPAREILAAVRAACADGTVEPAAAAAPVPAEGSARVVIDRALSQLGVTYAWGGGDAHGPTLGIRDGGVADAHGDYAKVGFDCSGLALFAYAGVGVAVPHQTKAIWAAYPHLTDRAALLPGDLLLYSDNGQASGIHHVSIYLGEDRMVEAPQSGEVVKISGGIWSGFRGAEFLGAVRPA